MRRTHAALALPALAASYAAVEAARIRRMPKLPERSRDLDALVGSGHAGAAVQLVVVGDSVASGVGCTRVETTFPWQLAHGVADDLARPVRVRSLSRKGSCVADARAEQLPRLAELSPVDVVVTSMGANDATHLTPPARFDEDLLGFVEDLRALTAAPLVLTGVPEFRSLRALGAPLRTTAWLAGQRVHAQQRALAAERADVAFADVLGAVGTAFRADPEGMLAEDGFHPGDRGAAVLADAVRPTVTAVLCGDPAAAERAHSERAQDEPPPGVRA